MRVGAWRLASVKTQQEEIRWKGLNKEKKLGRVPTRFQSAGTVCVSSQHVAVCHGEHGNAGTSSEVSVSHPQSHPPQYRWRIEQFQEQRTDT